MLSLDKAVSPCYACSRAISYRVCFYDWFVLTLSTQFAGPDFVLVCLDRCFSSYAACPLGLIFTFHYFTLSFLDLSPGLYHVSLCPFTFPPPPFSPVLMLSLSLFPGLIIPVPRCWPSFSRDKNLSVPSLCSSAWEYFHSLFSLLISSLFFLLDTVPSCLSGGLRSTQAAIRCFFSLVNVALFPNILPSFPTPHFICAFFWCSCKLLSPTRDYK